jgi:hypothetical protein
MQIVPTMTPVSANDVASGSTALQGQAGDRQVMNRRSSGNEPAKDLHMHVHAADIHGAWQMVDAYIYNVKAWTGQDVPYLPMTPRLNVEMPEIQSPLNQPCRSSSALDELR